MDSRSSPVISTLSTAGDAIVNANTYGAHSRNTQYLALADSTQNITTNNYGPGAQVYYLSSSPPLPAPLSQTPAQQESGQETSSNGDDPDVPKELEAISNAVEDQLKEAIMNFMSKGHAALAPTRP